MKNQLTLFALSMLLFCTACQVPSGTDGEAEAPPDYALFEKNMETVRAFFQAHSDENYEAMQAMLSDTLQWSPAAYNGDEWLGKADFLAAIKGYQDGFEDITFTEGIMLNDARAAGMWSGSVFPEEQATANPSNIRIYGTWHATHSETGRDVGVKYYAIAFFNEAQEIVRMTEYFDVGGLLAQVAAE